MESDWRANPVTMGQVRDVEMSPDELISLLDWRQTGEICAPSFVGIPDDATVVSVRDEAQTWSFVIRIAHPSFEPVRGGACPG